MKASEKGKQALEDAGGGVKVADEEHQELDTRRRPIPSPIDLASINFVNLGQVNLEFCIHRRGEAEPLSENHLNHDTWRLGCWGE